MEPTLNPKTPSNEETEATATNPEAQPQEAPVDPDSDTPIPQITSFSIRSESQKTRDESFQETLLSRVDDLYKEYYLSDLLRAAAGNFIMSTIENTSNTKRDRVRQWLYMKLTNRRIISDLHFQKGCPGIIPKLRAKPWWGVEDFPWIKTFEKKFLEIKEEVLALKDKSGFQPYRTPTWMYNDSKANDGVGAEGTSKGSWNLFYLFLHEVRYEENIAMVPKIIDLLTNTMPRNYQHAMISAMVPGTHIVPHYGPTNKKLRFHLPLIGVPGSYLKVAGETRALEAGKAYVFDDSFEHEAWHEGEHTRVILIADFWHPDLSDEEGKFFSMLQRSQLRFEKKLSELHKEEDNFFNVIDKAKGVIKDNEWWTVAQNEGYKVVND